MNLRNFFFPWRMTGIVIKATIRVYILLSSMDILAILIVLIHIHVRYFHLCVCLPSSNSLSAFCNFHLWRSFSLWDEFTPRYLIFNSYYKWACFVIPFSASSLWCIRMLLMFLYWFCILKLPNLAAYPCSLLMRSLNCGLQDYMTSFLFGYHIFFPLA